MYTQKVWLVTGAGKGFGFEITKAALAAGDKVIASVRSKPGQLAAALEHHPALFIVQMDVTNEAQVQAAVASGVAHFGHLAVVVNNAGYGMVAAIEEATDAEARRQYDTNVFGVLNVIRAVLPVLRQQQSGHIINISSLYAYGVLPGWALYGSTKFAIEGISQGLSAELEPFGIHVTAVAPGLFSTDFLSAESFVTTSHPIAEYDATTVGQMRAGSAQFHGQQPGDPKKLAQVIVQLAHTEQPPVHLPIGRDAVDMYQKNAASTAQEIAAWLPVSTRTDRAKV
ncbi:SDR family NAD(P)-dependent oxidoreductase [Hymenobacter terricola]|uniref:SDR family NAD(P)-dependent oxidoreductase n=1 Tax=Hymenobacter terricola TaxID=2819236 RepID=UPI001B310352|nr:SDR family NAD(P)-dependent oxidoreductase [Hymenobacter terricola]